MKDALNLLHPFNYISIDALFRTAWSKAVLCMTIMAVMLFLQAPAHADSQEIVGDNIVGGKFRVITIEEEQAMQEAVAREARARAAGGSDGSLILYSIPSSYTGTGLSEWIEYQLPNGYNPTGDPYPMAVCWHGYGQSVMSVAVDSQVDDECEDRGWLFLSITSAYQCNYGVLDAQTHCSKAIQYFIEELEINVDTDRIYMFGFSMGAGAATNYASRHLRGGEGYPVAGLVLVSPAFDWVHAYYQNDAGVQYWLPYLIGGPPGGYDFEYRQISSVAIDFGSTYDPGKSMGLNLGNGIPIYLTYASNDPLAYLPVHNEIFIQMMTDYGADLELNYIIDAPVPHHWQLLDVDAAFDFIETYSLSDQDPTSLELLADRDVKSYFADIVQETAGEFSEVQVEADAYNRLIVNEATNVNTLTADCAWCGLNDQNPLYVDFTSTSPAEQTVKLKPIATEPTYIVDDRGVLHPGYSYNSGDQEISIELDTGVGYNLKTSFEEYLLFLASVETATLLQKVPINLSGGDPYDHYLLIVSLVQTETKVGIHHLLIYPLPPEALWLFAVLDANGQASFNVTVPYDPGLLGLTFYQQFLTHDPAIKEVSNMESTLIQL